MQTAASSKPDYGNWVSKKFIYVPGVLCLLLIGFSFLWAWWILAPVAGHQAALLRRSPSPGAS